MRCRSLLARSAAGPSGPTARPEVRTADADVQQRSAAVTPGPRWPRSGTGWRGSGCSPMPTATLAVRGHASTTRVDPAVRALPAAPGPHRRRRRRSADLPPARRGALAARRPGAPLHRQPPVAATTSPRCSSGCSTWASTPAASTASSARAPSSALREFQRNIGLARRRHVRPATLQALDRLSRTVVGGRPDALREPEAIRRSGPTLAGKVVVIDPGHGGGDRRRLRPRARRGRRRRGPRGPRRGPAAARAASQAFLTRGSSEDGADARRRGPRGLRQRGRRRPVVSLHVDRNASPAAARRRDVLLRRRPQRRALGRRRAARRRWCSARSSRAPTCSTAARTRRRGTCCARPGCRPCASSSAT